MIFGSICSGIEAASVAFQPLGWKCSFLSEIDDFCRALLEYRFSDIPLFGDFTKIEKEQIQPIDLLIGGTPCQSFSIAGRRAGMDDSRGVLSFEFIRFLDRVRPRWFIFENVSGFISSRRGEDFKSWLREVTKLGYGFAYRILDAQYFGVPQRRRRVFVVGYFGDWRPAATVLFESQSLRGDFTPRRSKGKNVAALTATGVGTCGADDNQAQAGHLIAPTLQAHAAKNWVGSPMVVGTLMASGAGMERPAGMASEDSFLVPVAFSCKDYGADAGEISPTLRAMGHTESHMNAGGQVAVVPNSPPHTEFHRGVENAPAYKADTTPLLYELREKVGAETFAKWRFRILISLQSPQILRPEVYGYSLRREASEIESWLDDSALSRSQTLPEGALREMWESALRGTPPRRKLAEQLIREFTASMPILPHEGASAVRRLTPREAERLQGFPDDWTLVPFKGKEASDSRRYKALGNSMAVPVIHWLGQRIDKVENIIGHK